MTALSASCTLGRDKLALADYSTRRLVLVACGTRDGHAYHTPGLIRRMWEEARHG